VGTPTGGRLFRSLGVIALALTGCSAETRSIDADLPVTPPQGPDDARIARYQGNFYQISQGSRYFGWYGCGACHDSHAAGVLNLGDSAWAHGSRFDQVYGFIAHGHPGPYARYGQRIAPEQLWQLTAYVRDMPNWPPVKIRRQTVDASGEPQGRSWTGPAQ
jgi:cytochrome c oxidase cbb3-type subunit 3